MIDTVVFFLVWWVPAVVMLAWAVSGPEAPSWNGLLAVGFWLLWIGPWLGWVIVT